MDLHRTYILTVVRRKKIILVEYWIDWDWQQAIRSFEGYCAIEDYKADTITLDRLVESSSRQDGSHIVASTEEVTSRKPS
jgi:hypothetical protein